MPKVIPPITRRLRGSVRHVWASQRRGREGGQNTLFLGHPDESPPPSRNVRRPAQLLVVKGPLAQSPPRQPRATVITVIKHSPPLFVICATELPHGMIIPPPPLRPSATRPTQRSSRDSSRDGGQSTLNCPPSRCMIRHPPQPPPSFLWLAGNNRKRVISGTSQPRVVVGVSFPLLPGTTTPPLYAPPCLDSNRGNKVYTVCTKAPGVSKHNWIHFTAPKKKRFKKKEKKEGPG